MKQLTTDVVIIAGGPAGLAAAAHYGWNVVGAVSGDEARTAEDIHDEIYSIIKGA